MRLCGFQEKNSSRYITRSALGNHTDITNTNGEDLIQKLRHRPHWLQHGIEKASEVNAAREERREAAGAEGLRSRGAKGTEEGLWLHAWAPVAHMCSHRAPTSTG